MLSVYHPIVISHKRLKNKSEKTIDFIQICAMMKVGVENSRQRDGCGGRPGGQGLYVPPYRTTSHLNPLLKKAASWQCLTALQAVPGGR